MSDADHHAIALGAESAEALFQPPAPKQGPPEATQAPLVLAIGDSWFNYWPRGDILDVLEDELEFDIERNAKPGRTLAEMLFTDPRKSDELMDGPAVSWLVGRIKNLDREDRHRLRAILISAGGNDVAGDPETLKLMVIPENGRASSLNESGVASFVDQTLRGRFMSLLACINHACDLSGLGRVPILLHGYSYPVPDGRGVLGINWLIKPLEELQYKNPERRAHVMNLLIDRLNVMQRGLIADHPEQFANVVHVDVRKVLLNDPARYRLYWQNELHPTIPLGFGEVAKGFIKALTGGPATTAAVHVRGATSSTSSRTLQAPDSAEQQPARHFLDPA